MLKEFVMERLYEEEKREGLIDRPEGSFASGECRHHGPRDDLTECR
jgi:hypothetical protein